MLVLMLQLVLRDLRFSYPESCVFSFEFDLTIVIAVAHTGPEMLQTFHSMKNSGGRRPCSAQPDRIADL
jgi:hypothetical protein